jgi:hypothetical protein
MSDDNDTSNGNDGPGEKKFSQDDLDRIISERLERDRKKYTDRISALEATIGKGDENHDQDKVLQDRITKLEGILGKISTGRLSDLPAPIKALVDKMDVADRLEWLETNAAEVQQALRKPIPAVPDGSAKMATLDELAAKKSQNMDYSL